MNIEYMELAIKEAKKAYKKDDIPVGAVIVKDNEVIAKGFNNRHAICNVLGHAEIVAIKKAQKKLHDWRLYDCDLYVTLKPCSMCEAVIKESRMNKVYFLLDKPDQKRGYQHTKMEFLSEMPDEKRKKYQQLLSSFFESKR